MFYQVSRAIEDGGVSLGLEPLKHLLLGTHNHPPTGTECKSFTHTHPPPPPPSPSSLPALCLCSVTSYLIPHSFPSPLPVSFLCLPFYGQRPVGGDDDDDEKEEEARGSIQYTTLSNHYKRLLL